MSNQRTTQALLKAILCVLVLGCRVRANESFIEHFSDGDVQDGSPVTWQWDASTGDCVLTPEGFRLSPSKLGQGLLAVACSENGRALEYAGNLTVRAQLRVGDASMANGALILLQGEGNPAGYLLGINTMVFYLARLQPYYCPAEWHYVMNGQFDPTEDIIIQLDVTDILSATGERTTSRLECRMWRPGEAMPVTPQITGDDATRDVGRVVIGANPNTDLSRSSVLFQWVEVTHTETEKIHIVDFNGNGTVDTQDLVKLIHAWGQDEPTVDLVPDGVVDEKDLEVLMDYWHQDVNDPTLLGHWKLDETEGDVACETVAQEDAAISGEAVWKPESGRHKGALAFDGIDDCMETPFVLDPAAGAFSIFVWVKGGAPGQVVLSQVGGANWLGLDQAGNLFTDLKGEGRKGGQPLHSETSVTDGQWHRVGLVWDRLYRNLYVDDQLVAADVGPQDNFSSAAGELCLGAGTNAAPDTFWSGMMDEVRIYNRVVAP